MNFILLVIIALTGIVSATFIPEMSEMDTALASPRIKREEGKVTYDCKGHDLCGSTNDMRKSCDETINAKFKRDDALNYKAKRRDDALNKAERYALLSSYYLNYTNITSSVE